MKIAICDDNKEDCKKLKEDLITVWNEKEIDEYYNGQSLIYRIEDGENYDVIFLDIFLEETDGIKLGRRIQQIYRGGGKPELVFVSNSREFGPEAFELNALYYFVKPYEKEMLREIKKRLQNKQVSKVEIYDSKSRQKQEIPYQKITYIESVHNYLHIHLTTGMTVKVRGSLQTFAENLDERFLRINRGIIVNMEAVEKMNLDSCEIEGLVFMLSRRQRAEKRRKYNDYIFKYYMDKR